MSAPQVTVALSRLANLANALDDYQSFMESGDGDLALASKEHVQENIDGIRHALTSLERSVGLTGAPEIHAVPDRVSDDWDTAA